MKRFDDVITNYVREGGRFAGICLGAYLAGQDMGFGLTPPSSTIVREIEQPGSKVKDEGDTTIDLSWSFQDGTTRPENIFFQDGAAIIDSTVTVLGTYSSNGDIAASLNAYGKGWVALSGCHVEADEAYCELYSSVTRRPYRRLTPWNVHQTKMPIFHSLRTLALLQGLILWRRL